MDDLRKKRLRNRSKLPKRATRYHHEEDNEGKKDAVKQVVSENNKRSRELDQVLRENNKRYEMKRKKKKTASKDMRKRGKS